MNKNNTIFGSKNKFNEDVLYSRSTLPSHSLYQPIQLSPSYSSPSSLINCEVKKRDTVKTKKHAAAASRPVFQDGNEYEQIEDLPLFFNQGEFIRIPKSVEATLKRIPKELTKAINPKRNIAIEMCLLFLSKLSLALYYEDEKDSWVFWGARYMRSLFNDDPQTYKNILAVLIYNGTSGSIIEIEEGDNIGIKAHKYRYTKEFRSRKMERIRLKTDYVKGLSKKLVLELYRKAKKDIIGNNQIQVYSSIALPTIKSAFEQAKSLIAVGENFTKKGKKLVFLNKHARSYYKNPNNLSFIEEHIELFEYLTSDGLLVPSISRRKAGGRVFDSLNRMPRWIRDLVTIDGEPTDECDFSCFHPNLAIKLYGGKQKYLTHKKLADATGLDEAVVKVQHLSFFNKTYGEMKQSPIYPYYREYEPAMLNNIIREKLKSKREHKITSERLFTAEVEIMKKVISLLNKENIYTIYVFDALFCKKQHTYRVKEVMNQVAHEFGVFTTAKAPNDKSSLN